MLSHARELVMRYYGPLMTALVILLFILMTAAAKEFINYTTIQQNINNQIQAQEYRNEKIAFEEHFLIPYLGSSSALFFYQHENNILGANEYIIHIQEPEQTTEPIIQTSNVYETQEAWHKFLARVREYILEH